MCIPIVRDFLLARSLLVFHLRRSYDIVDERHNGGGQVADYYIDILRRPFISNCAMRYGTDLRTPLAAIQGPKR